MTTASRLTRQRPFGQNYAFVVAGAIFLALLAAAGLRAAPGVLILPLEKAFGWDRGSISLAAGVGIFLYGLTGPFAAALMQSFGLRKTVTLALLLMAASTGLSAFMTASWQYVATWGVLAGFGSGAVAMVLGATVVNRWFVARRGLMLGLLTASTATGSLIFLPGMALIADHGGWKPVVVTVAIVCRPRSRHRPLAPSPAGADTPMVCAPRGAPVLRARRQLWAARHSPPPFHPPIPSLSESLPPLSFSTLPLSIFFKIYNPYKCTIGQQKPSIIRQKIRINYEHNDTTYRQEPSNIDFSSSKYSYHAHCSHQYRTENTRVQSTDQTIPYYREENHTNPDIKGNKK